MIQTRKTHPYMCRQCFPGDCPTLKMIRQYINNAHKYERRKRRLRGISDKDKDMANSDQPDLDELRDVEDEFEGGAYEG